jgi:polysaccharide export outer membrane protein
MKIRTLLPLLLSLVLLCLAGASRAAAEGEYILGEGDLLKITVYNNPDLNTEARVSGDGKIAFPLIGEVAVYGMTVSEAEKNIVALLQDGYILKPHVSILILEYKKTVYVNGEVKNPGAYKLTQGLTVLKAITLAGGLTPKAGESRIKIIRKTGKGETALKAKMDDLVQPDDVVLVPESLF